MTEFPSHKIVWLTLLLLFLYFGVRFFLVSGKEIHQTKFDWKNKTLEGSIYDIKVDTFSYNFLRINKPQKFTTNSSSTYEIKDKENTFYFRYIYAKESDSTIEFRNLKWITDIPERFIGEIEMGAYDIPLNQEGNNTVITIGDEWMYYNEAKYLRKLVASEVSVVFRGRSTDFFNYPLEANYKNDLNAVIDLSDTVEKADYYILFFDGTCEKIKNDELTQKLQLILDNLNKNNPKKIIWITYPFVKESKDYICHQKYNKAINSLSHKKLITINTDSIFKEDLKQYIMPDGSYLNKKAYQQIANQIIDEIND